MLEKTDDLYPDGATWQMMQHQAGVLVQSGMLPPSIRTPVQAIAVMLKGRELGWPPMLSFSAINIIQGKPTLTAEAMLALILRAYPETKIQYTQNDDEACRIKVTKPGNDANEFSFSFEDAQKAKLTSKANWSLYRRAMLRSRCISEMARSLFPDALQGCSYTPEELEPLPHEPMPVQQALPSPAPRMEKGTPQQRMPKVVANFAQLAEPLSEHDLYALVDTSFENLDEAHMDMFIALYRRMRDGKTTRHQIMQEYGLEA